MPKTHIVNTGEIGSGPSGSVDMAETNLRLGPTNESPAANDTATSGLNGLFKRFLQRLTNLIDRFPASIGQKAKTTSLAVTLASDEDLLPRIGATDEAVAASDTATSGLNGLFKRLLQQIALVLADLQGKADLSVAEPGVVRGQPLNRYLPLTVTNGGAGYVIDDCIGGNITYPTVYPAIGNAVGGGRGFTLTAINLILPVATTQTVYAAVYRRAPGALIDNDPFTMSDENLQSAIVALTPSVSVGNKTHWRWEGGMVVQQSTAAENTTDALHVRYFTKTALTLAGTTGHSLIAGYLD